MAARQIVLYGSGLFGRNLPRTNAEQLAAVRDSGFTTVILWTLHVDPDGTLAFNDAVIVSGGVFANTFSYLPELIDGLTRGGSVTRVLFGIGSGGTSDFGHIGDLLATPAGRLTLNRNFHALSSALPIDGYDLDDEDSDSPTTLVELTKLLADNRMTITFCPYTNQKSLWNPALETIYEWDLQRGLEQTVQWWNLQNYAGGAGNNPAAWVTGIDPNLTGVRDPAAFVVPGFDASVQEPASVQLTFAGLRSSNPGINGGFIWNSEHIFAGPHTPADYARAIRDGLAGQRRSD